jgi:hypothetical protein
MPTPCGTFTWLPLNISGTQQFFRGGPGYHGQVPSYFTATLVNDVVSGSGCTVDFALILGLEQVSPTVDIHTYNVRVNAGFSKTVTFWADPGTDEITLKMSAVGGSGVSSGHGNIDVYCGVNVTVDLSEVLAAVKHTYVNSA